MYVDDKFLTSDYEHPKEHLKLMLRAILDTLEKERKAVGVLDLYRTLDTYACLKDFCQIHDIAFIQLNNNDLADSNTIHVHLKNYFTKTFYFEASNVYSHYFNKTKYNFNDDEYEVIQDNISSLRAEITKSTIFSDEHKARLLAKLEKLQAELHKKMNTLDSILGGFVSVAKTLHIFGEESKPMFDRVNETLGAISKVQDRGDNLPSVDNQISFNVTPQVEMVEE